MNVNETGFVVLIAGPSCSGKTSRVKGMRSGILSGFTDAPGLDLSINSRIVTARQLETGRRRLKPSGTQFIHYETTRLIKERHVFGFGEDPVFDIIHSDAPDLIIHLDPEHEVLMAMLAERYNKRRRSCGRLIRPLHENRRLAFLRQLQVDYAIPEWLTQHVFSWRSFAAERFSCPHWEIHHHGFHRKYWVNYVRLTHMVEPLEKVFRSCCSLSG